MTSRASFIPPGFQNDRLAFGIPKVAKSLSKCIELLQWRATGCKDADPWHSPYLLGFSERRGKEAAGDHAKEGTSVHKNPRMTADLGGTRRSGPRVDLTTGESRAGVTHGSP